jgi:hypothetical protein
MTDTRRPGRSRSTEAGLDPGGDRLAELEARLAQLERRPGMRERGRSMMDRVMPPEASAHFRNAGREQLLGVRSIVDFWIARLDDADARASSHRRERETIEID